MDDEAYEQIIAARHEDYIEHAAAANSWMASMNEDGQPAGEGAGGWLLNGSRSGEQPVRVRRRERKEVASMELSLKEIRTLIEAVGTLDAEYGLDETGAALLERLRETRDRREAEIREREW